jgi:hypothetical protein
MLRDIIILILGWLLGLLAPVIVEYIREKREIKVIKPALLEELREFRFRLLLLIYRVESKYGKLDKEFFKWAQSILIEYDGINSSDSLLKAIGTILKLTPEEISECSQFSKQIEKQCTGLSLKKIYLPLLESNVSFLSKFDSILRNQLLEIRTRVEFMNEIVEDSRYYFRLSFQDGISKENYDIANTNMISSYNVYASQARDIIEIIGKILSTKGYHS